MNESTVCVKMDFSVFDCCLKNRPETLLTYPLCFYLHSENIMTWMDYETLSSDILQVKHSCKELLLVQKLHLNFSLSFFFYAGDETFCYVRSTLTHKLYKQLHYKCDWKVNTASETPSALISLILNDLELHIMSCVLLCV